MRVKSTDHLDVHFFIWGKGLWYACSSLILEEITPGWPTAFFSNPGQKESSLGKVKKKGLKNIAFMKIVKIKRLDVSTSAELIISLF